MTGEEFWNRCLKRIRAEVSEQQFNTWLRPLQPQLDDGELKLFAPNRFVVDRLNQEFIDRLRAIAADVNGAPMRVIGVVGSVYRESPSVSSIAPNQPERRATNARERVPMPESRLMPGFTFENFVEGKSNQLARAAATQVAANLGQAYNPLFLYGGVGLGKTHLMHAVGNYVLEQQPDARVCYVHS